MATKYFIGEKEIGIVTSGTFSPTLNKAIGLAFIDIAFSAPDTEIAIAIRDTMTARQKLLSFHFIKGRNKIKERKYHVQTKSNRQILFPRS